MLVCCSFFAGDFAQTRKAVECQKKTPILWSPNSHQKQMMLAGQPPPPKQQLNKALLRAAKG